MFLTTTRQNFQCRMCQKYINVKKKVHPLSNPRFDILGHNTKWTEPCQVLNLYSISLIDKN